MCRVKYKYLHLLVLCVMFSEKQVLLAEKVVEIIMRNKISLLKHSSKDELNWMWMGASCCAACNRCQCFVD